MGTLDHLRSMVLLTVVVGGKAFCQTGSAELKISDITAEARPYSEVLVLITGQDLEDLISITDIRIQYNTSFLSLPPGVNIGEITPGPLLSGMVAWSNSIPANGEVRISVAGIYSVSGNGVLFSVRFQVASTAAPGTSILSLIPGRLDDSHGHQLAAEFGDGSLTLVNPPPTATATPSLSSTNTPTSTITPTHTLSPTPSWTFTAMFSPTRTPTLTRTRSSTRTPSLTRTKTSTRTRTLTRTHTLNPTFTSTPTVTATRTSTRTRTPTRSQTLSFTRTPSRTFTSTRTRTPTRSRTSTRTQSLTRTPTPAPLLSLASDLNGDASVNLVDLRIVARSLDRFPGDSAYDPRADLNKDGIVNLQDAGIVKKDFVEITGTGCESLNVCPTEVYFSSSSTVVRSHISKIEELSPDQLVVEVIVEHVNQLTGYQFDLYYEPDELEFLNLSSGPFLRDVSSESDLVTLNVDTSVCGAVIRIVATRCHPDGVDGTGVLCNIAFRIITEVRSGIGLAEVVMVGETESLTDESESTVGMLGRGIDPVATIPVRIENHGLGLPVLDINHDGLIETRDLIGLLAFEKRNYPLEKNLLLFDISRLWWVVNEN